MLFSEQGGKSNWKNKQMQIFLSLSEKKTSQKSLIQESDFFLKENQKTDFQSSP